MDSDAVEIFFEFDGDGVVAIFGGGFIDGIDGEVAEI